MDSAVKACCTKFHCCFTGLSGTGLKYCLHLSGSRKNGKTSSTREITRSGSRSAGFCIPGTQESGGSTALQNVPVIPERSSNLQ